MPVYYSSIKKSDGTCAFSAFSEHEVEGNTGQKITISPELICKLYDYLAFMEQLPDDEEKRLTAQSSKNSIAPETIAYFSKEEYITLKKAVSVLNAIELTDDPTDLQLKELFSKARKPTVEKYPLFIFNKHDESQLLPGDIILFRPSIYAPRSPLQTLIQLMQALVIKKDGHYDTTHTSICVGNDEFGRPLMAHVTAGKGGYVKEPLEEMINVRDGGERPFLVYRPKNTEMALNLSAIAGNEGANRTIKITMRAASSAFRTISIFNPDRTKTQKTLDEKSICSTFVVQSIKKAAKEHHHPEFDIDINDSSSPKMIESYVHQDREHYEQLIYCGKTDPYVAIKAEIEQQIERLKKSHALSILKAQSLSDALNAFEQHHLNLPPLDKAVSLINHMSESLKHNTGLSIYHTQSFQAVLKKARGMGIFSRDLEEQHPSENEHFDASI